MNVDISKHYDFANDKWYFKTLWLNESVFCIMNVDISKHYDLQMINDG